MAWYRKKTTELMDYKEPTDEDEFLNDWNACRDRHAGQKAVIQAFDEGNHYIFNRAGRKFSKTTTKIDIGWKFCNTHPSSVCYLCYPTITQGIEVCWEEGRLQTCDRKDDMMKQKYVRKTDDNKHTITFTNGSFIKLIGTWSEARGRGTQPDLLLVDEVQDCSASYLDAMDPNLAAKDGRCVMGGTPPPIKNHYHEWEERIRNMSRGKVFHFSSYCNDKIPHLKQWLDEKRIELIKSGKEDVWKREYLAEDCFVHKDRVLPEPEFKTYEALTALISQFAYEERIPVIATTAQDRYFCTVIGVLIPGRAVIITDVVTYPQIWDKRVHDIYQDVEQAMKPIRDLCMKKVRNVVYDPTMSFQDLISGFTKCREDIKWQKRGIPILRELMLNKKIHLCDRLSDLGMECQKLFMDESQKEIEKQFMITCTLAILVNEFFQLEKVQIDRVEDWNKFKALRDMGIIPPGPKNKGKSLFKYGM